MKDYSKYYIQGSDHYLIPKDEFENLLTDFEVISNALETEDKMGDYLRFEVYRLSLKNQQLQKTIDDAVKFIERKATDENGDIGINLFANQVFDLLNILKSGRNNYE